MNNTNKCEGLPYLRLNGIYKIFGHTKALNNMNLDVHLGEVVGLIGPNGAGKSTLIKVITGMHQPTEGTIEYGGVVASSDYDANSAKENGIACAYQELSLCTNLCVYENFSLYHMDHKPYGTIGWRKNAKKEATRFLKEVFPTNNIDVNEIVDHLSLQEKQMVEIAKAISTKNLKVLLLDEPTSSLTTDTINELHKSVKKLTQAGVAVIYITHKMDEIEKISDKVTIMKGGNTVFNGNSHETSLDEIMNIMGGDLIVGKKEHTRNNNETILAIEDYSNAVLKRINLEVNKGEIVGISGLAGAGQSDLLLSILKAYKSRRTSRIHLNGSVSYVSGDRTEEGVFPLWDIADNINISSLDKVSERGLVSKEKENVLAQHWYDKLKFVAEGIHANILSLSGGNQQKALIARGIASDADLIILNDPTCGVDIQTKQEIYKLLEEAKNNGKSIILHSTEDMEMEQCDRVYIMHEGTVISELKHEEINVNNIIKSSFSKVLDKKDSKDKHEVDAPAIWKQKKQNILTRLLYHRSFLAFFTLFIILIANIMLNSRIFSYLGIDLLYSSAVPLVFVALGQMFMIISGGIDLGNGMSVGLVNVIVAFTLVNKPSLGIGFIALFVIAYGIVGYIVHKTKIQAIVVTLGASFIWLGAALLISPTPGGQSPAFLAAFFNFNFPIIPMPIVISILGGAVAYWIVKQSKYGMVMNGFGNNPESVARAGWNQTTIMVVSYMLSGAFVVLGGLMVTAVANSGDGNSTAAYNMLSIATVILGGCEFKGGIGNPVGVVAAALAISSISALLTFIGVDSNLQSAVTGLILILALAIKLVSHKMEEKA